MVFWYQGKYWWNSTYSLSNHTNRHQTAFFVWIFLLRWILSSQNFISISKFGNIFVQTNKTHPNHFSLLSSRRSIVQNVDQILRVELVFTKNNLSPLLKYSLDTHSLHSPSHRDMDKQTDNARHLFAWSCYSMNWKTLNLTHWTVGKATTSSLWFF